jgi:orotidine-5'-phosphate decarboxylase
MNPKDKIIVALDVSDLKEAEKLLISLKNEASYIKIGMEAYYSFGADIIKLAKEFNYKVFLDLKLHDIPNTVYRTVKSLSSLGVDMINVHAMGGLEMMKKAKQAVLESEVSTTIIAVTQLTSTTQDMIKSEISIDIPLKESVLNLARNAQEAGLNGVVCSAQEVSWIKKNTSPNFICVTPGIRPKSSKLDDQKRVMTPKEALDAGSDFLVIGRPITQADDPSFAFNSIVKDAQ